MNLGFYSYLGAAIGFGFFAVQLLFSWRNSVQGRLLTVAVVVSAIWAGFAAKIPEVGITQSGVYQAFEISRCIAWYVFLLKLLEPAATRKPEYRNFVRWVLPVSVSLGLLLLAGEWLPIYSSMPVPIYELVTIQMTGHLLLAIIGLAIIEQLFRNTPSGNRYAVKYLFISIGGIFAFDFYLYADALLFRGINRELWEARGFVNLVAVPMLAISTARNKDWSLNVFVSRDIVLHTTTLLGGGLYLLVMAGAGYYLREYGGSWGRVTQFLFFALAVALLAAVLFSEQLRTQLRVFLAKHFYRNKYDYRREWLQLTRALDDKSHGEDSYESAIRAMVHLVDARAGLLWLRNEQADYENVAVWNASRFARIEPRTSTLVRFLEDKSYVINLLEIEVHPDEYEGLELPVWVATVPHGWLVVPLIAQGSLMGFVVLANPLVARSINWEDRDLLKTAAKQVSGYLSVLMASEALARARQFEAFSQLSAYMVHDLKNITAELELVAKNAKKHIGNPEFLDDAFDTVATASGDINRLLNQLRNKRVQFEREVVVNVGALMTEVIRKKRDQLPVPTLEEVGKECLVIAGKDRLMNVLMHLIDNAQQATTAEEGVITVKLDNRESRCVIEIRDNGHGMDAAFLRQRLFKPFDTTKGNAGMGIGMYESREFINQLGGEIQVESEPGKGTVVVICLPSSAVQSGSPHAEG